MTHGRRVVDDFPRQTRLLVEELADGPVGDEDGEGDAPEELGARTSGLSREETRGKFGSLLTGRANQSKSGKKPWNPGQKDPCMFQARKVDMNYYLFQARKVDHSLRKTFPTIVQARKLISLTFPWQPFGCQSPEFPKSKVDENWRFATENLRLAPDRSAFRARCCLSRPTFEAEF